MMRRRLFSVSYPRTARNLFYKGFADFLCGAVAIPIMGRKREYLIVGHYADTLTFDFVQYELTALGKGLGGVGIADSEKRSEEHTSELQSR